MTTSRILNAAAAVALVFLVAVLAIGWFFRSAETRPTEERTHEVQSNLGSEPSSPENTKLAEAELQILQASQALLEGQPEEAERTLLGVLQREPHFRLAHALLGDLQRVRAGLPPALSDGNRELQALRYEWERRWQAKDSRPPLEAWPWEVVNLPSTPPHLFLVDAHALRLYWLKRGEKEDDPLRLEASFYISVGKAGVGKELEGDNKTPLGIYRIVGKKNASELPAFYGAGALVLDYPNPVDRSLQRTGKGIWLHGSPPNTYTRDPLASEGCVVLSNTDMQKLMSLPDVMGAPVVIVEKPQWLNAQQHRRVRAEAFNSLEAWVKENLQISVDWHKLGMLRWKERNGQVYWRIGYHDPTNPSLSFDLTLREEDDTWVAIGSDNERSVARSDRAFADLRTAEEDKTVAPTSPASSRRSSPDLSKQHGPLRTVHAWAEAWSARDVNRYLAYYHPEFKPDGLSRRDWIAQRKQRILEKKRIDVEVLQPRVRLNGQTASVTFVQRYRSDGQRELRARKTLVLQKDGQRWLIVEERTG